MVGPVPTGSSSPYPPSAEGLAYCRAVSTNRVVVLINTSSSWRKYLRAIPRNHISSSTLMRLACDYNIVKRVAVRGQKHVHVDKLALSLVLFYLTSQCKVR